MSARPGTVKCAAARTPIPFRFRAIPSEVMASKTLSSTAKLLLAAIMDAARGNKSGLCKISNKTLGDRIGRCESEVGRYLQELEAAGLIRREYGKSMRVRAGIAVTWSESVPDLPATQDRESTTSREPGSAKVGNPVPQGPGTSRTPVEPTVEPAISLSDDEKRNQTGSLDLDSGEKKPTQAEIAAALRSMVAGTFAPMMFGEAKPEAMPEAPRGSKASLPAKPDPNPGPGAPGGLQGEPGVVRTMFGRIGYSARAAAFRPLVPKKTPDQVIDELRRASAAREREGVGIIRPG